MDRLKSIKKIILREIESQKGLVTCIVKRHSKFFGHVMKRGKLEYVVTTEKFEGKRGRKRPKEIKLNS